MPLKVEALKFYGRLNPTWRLTEAEEEELRAIIITLHKIPTISSFDWPSPFDKYRGFIVSRLDDGTRSWSELLLLCKETIEVKTIGKDTYYLNDPDLRLDSLLNRSYDRYTETSKEKEKEKESAKVTVKPPPPPPPPLPPASLPLIHPNQPTVRPITPDEVMKLRETYIPGEVYEVFNDLIVKKWDGRCSVIKQIDVLTQLLEKISDLTSTQIWERRYLDIEKYYEEAGWKVVYDKPGFSECYEPTFEFTRKLG